jgi:hypothetical protein
MRYIVTCRCGAKTGTTPPTGKPDDLAECCQCGRTINKALGTYIREPEKQEPEIDLLKVD